MPFLKFAISTEFKKNYFDAIVSIAVFHCFLENERDRYVQEVSRILKKGGYFFQLVLSSEYETMKSGEEIEENTFLQRSGTPFHLFTEKELKDYLSDLEFIKINLHVKDINGKRIAVYTMILKKK